MTLYKIQLNSNKRIVKLNSEYLYGFLDIDNKHFKRLFDTNRPKNQLNKANWSGTEIERKAMIRNRYNYLTTSVQNIKGKDGRTSSNNTTIKTLQAESQKDSFFPKIGQTAIQNKNSTRTYMQIHRMTETVNRSRSTALERSVKIFTGGGGGDFNQFYMATTSLLIMPWYTQDICSVCVKGF